MIGCCNEGFERLIFRKVLHWMLIGSRLITLFRIRCQKRVFRLKASHSYSFYNNFDMKTPGFVANRKGNQAHVIVLKHTQT